MSDPCNVDPPRPRALCPGCNDLVPVVGVPNVGDVYAAHFATMIEQTPMIQMIVDLWLCDGTGLPIRACRVCGCTELDCSGCVAKTGAPCSWIEDDLCSACESRFHQENRLARDREKASALERQRHLASYGNSVGDWGGFKEILEDPASYNDSKLRMTSSNTAVYEGTEEEFRTEIMGQFTPVDGQAVSIEDYMPDAARQRLTRFGQDLDPANLPSPVVGHVIEEFRREFMGELDLPVDEEEDDAGRKRR